MKISQKTWTQGTGWITVKADIAEIPQLVFVFGARPLLSEKSHFDEIRTMYPQSHIVSASTAGEISNKEMLEMSLVVTAIHFEKTTLQFAKETISAPEQSLEVGKKLASALPHEGLVHVMVFSDGLKVNGTSLVKGFDEVLPSTVSVTGGLVGDGSDFKLTLVGLDKAPAEGQVIVLGLYGDSLKVGYGSLGGWDVFGPQRTITKAKNNVLFELDGKNALQLYKEYLGELAKELPASGLLFPLSLSVIDKSGKEAQIVRTLLNINETDQSMIFAGDMPEGTKAQLMKANFERLIDGAQHAASMSLESLTGAKPDLAILISCIGRKLVLKERTVEEIDAVRSIVGEQAAITGFYSYGEICPTAATEKQCQLHNQTMTITTFKEI